MSLPVFALFVRSLRVESRSIAMYLARLALVGFILFYLAVAHFELTRFGAPGHRFFIGVAYINFFFITLAGVSYFASCISEEKEEMTLGLLRMTRLDPLAILLGKSTSRTLGAVFFLLAQFPFTLLAITLGGVSLVQILAVYVTFLAYIVFLSGLAALCSVVCDRTGNSAGLMGLLLVLFFIAPPLTDAILTHWVFDQPGDRRSLFYVVPHWVLQQMDRMSAFSQIYRIMGTGWGMGRGGATSPWAMLNLQVISNLVIGAASFLLAWRVFDLFTRQQKEAAPVRTVAAARKGSPWRFFSPGRSWNDALIWKDFNFLTGGRAMLIAKFILYGGFILGIFLWWNSRPYGHVRWSEYCQGVSVIMLLVLFVEMIVYAGRVFNEESRWQTLSTLGMLPVSVRALAYRKVLGCLIACIPAAAYCLLAFLFALDDLGHISTNDLSVFCNLTCQGVAFLHLVAYLSLRLKRGAVPIAIALWIAGWILTVMSIEMFFRWRGGAGVIDVITLAILLVALVLHRLIGRELEKAMAV